MRPVLLSEKKSILDILNGNIDVDDIKIVAEYIDQASVIEEYFIETNDIWHFNYDFFIRFNDALNEDGFNGFSGGMRGTLPLTVGGTESAVLISKKTKEPYRLEQLFGVALPIKCYRKYIEVYNARIKQMDHQKIIPTLPIRRPKNMPGYLRFWVLETYMTVLYYPHCSLPWYDCEIREFYRSDDAEINLLKDKDKIIAIDGWMKIPDELQVKSDMRLVICE